jgi:hypothetical protein
MPKNAPYDFPEHLTDFAALPRFQENVATLVGLAEPEDWNYKNTHSEHPNPILNSYLKYTYKRIAEEKKISVTSDESLACWNTGLITINQEQIFILFTKNNIENWDQYWHFSRFVRKGERDLNKFSSLPEMAHYFDDPSVLVLDTRKEVRVNVEHVVSDNFDRFPDDVKAMSAFTIQNLVSGAKDVAIERAKRNYKTAIPQYYHGSVQLLIPLSLTDPERADLALVVEKFPDFYRAATCLTLDMAYNNARQLARPDRDWLAP